MEIQYYVAPWLLVPAGLAAFAVGVLVIVFRRALKRIIASGNRDLWGDRTGDRMDAASPNWLIAPGLAGIAFGILFIVFGIVGVVTHAPVTH